LPAPPTTCYNRAVIGPDDFRRLLGHFATGVTIVTTTDAEARPAGLTVSAFCSLSLDPPLVLVCVDHKAQTYTALRESGRFAVNILRAEHEALSRRFAGTGLDKFDGVAWRRSPRGLPLLEGALAHLECTTVATHDEGDHTIFVGRVEAGAVGPGEPLLYYRGQYQRLARGPA
jgi:flavin reductase (DIM6/NTAB) family NADH-FMN oxidoreductase RutF